MASERVQAQIDRLLSQAEDAVTQEDWALVAARARAVLVLDPENADAMFYQEAAARAIQTAAAAGGTPTLAPEPAPAQAAQPTSFADGRYEVKRFLGEGGKKKVYLAHDARLDRDVAFALIKAEGLDEAARERIAREAQAMGRLGNHPNIVTVYDIGAENGQPYMVLPVLAGGDVEGVVEKADDHKLPLERAIQIAVDTCQGLELAHSRGIIHRDIKPGNVFLSSQGTAMIADFGLAVAVDRSRLTQAGMMVGTVSYMPPEQAMGGEISPCSDLYSLGAMLYEMVCGRPPFVGDESVAIIGQHLNTPPVAPTWHRPDCPPALETLILRLLEKDPTKRPQSAAEVREALQAVSSSLLPGEEGGRRPDEGETSRTSTGPASAAADPLYRTVFVGREAELRQLQQAYDAAVSGQGGLVMVVGEPGIGKTALCEQLATYVSIRGGRTLIGHCYEEGSLSLPYLAFVEAMRSYVLARDPDGLKSDLGSGAADVARIVSEVRDRVQLAARPEALEGRDASDPEDDRWRLLQSVTSFLRNAATVQPLVIVLEDLHWADRGTLDLLQHVARNLQGARLVIVGTYRDVEVDRSHPLSGVVAELRRSATFLRVPLRGLTVDEVHRMYQTVRGQNVPWGQAEAVHRATEGNPLFVQEVLRYLVEEGIVVREDGRYVAKAPGEGVPEGLRDVIGRRLSHLSEQTNQVLTIASVIGRDFALDVLQHVAGMSEDEVLAALEEATGRSIIEQRPAMGSLGFRFTHAFFRQTLYEEIFAPRRIRWHQQVGRALEDVYARRLEEHAAELAEHFAQSTEAADLAKAVHYAELAAQRAMNVFACGEAVRHLDQAIRAQEVLDPDDAARNCDLWLALGEALLALAERARIIEEVAPRALSLAERLDDPDRAWRACWQAIDAATGPQTPETTLWQHRAEGFVAGNPRARIRLMHSKAGTANQYLRRREARSLANDAMQLARDLPDVELQFLLASLALSFSCLSPAEEIELMEEFGARSRAGVGSAVLSRFLASCACAFLARGQRGRAGEVLTELEEFASQNRYTRALNEARNVANLFDFLDGKIEDAAVVQVTTIKNGENRYEILPTFAILMGDLDLAAESMDRPAQTADDHPMVKACHGIFHAVAGNADTAAGLLKELIEIAPPGNEDDLTNQAGCLLLELALAVDDRPVTERFYRALKGSDGERSLAGPNAWICRPRLLGDAAVRLGHQSEARANYEEAWQFCESIRHRPELALSRLGLAEVLLEHYPDERAAAIKHLDFAIAEFRDMKMQPALERALGHRGLLKA